MDPKVKEENLNRMYGEGVEVASKIIAYLKEQLKDNNFMKLNRTERKKFIKENKPEFKTFIQLHPIVSEYLINEHLFSARAFKKYIKVVYGMEKSKEDQEFLAKDPKNVHYFKNGQYAIYYKFLLQESNSHLNLNDINNMYNELVTELNKETTKMLDRYEKASAEFKNNEEQLTNEKKKEFLELLNRKVNN
jgi:hypothetical protein